MFHRGAPPPEKPRRPEQGPGTRRTPGCYPGSDFLKDQIASDPGLAQEANWGDVTALVGTMADQIVAGIC